MLEKNPKRRFIILGLTFFGCLLILFFGTRLFHAYQKFNGHGPHGFAPKLETDVEQVRGWMTIPFISRMYGVPEPILYKALGIPEEGNHKKSLEDLDGEYFPEAAGTALQIVKATLLAHPAPPTPPNAPDAPLP
ncbi:MAG: hypothetical protein IT310_10900 [Anaerolineales bacterium]|nr:hypothetical protein [Anaerolineales bacterium]